MKEFCPITISETAIEEIKNIFATKNIPEEYYLRVGVKGGAGCGSGMSYVLGFDKKEEADQTFHIEGVDVLIEKKQVMFLAGTRIDFTDTSTNRGFTFEK